jgi:raffinose/stachyose/melibiose transport system permease protein
MTQSSTTTPLSGPSTAIATGAPAVIAPALAARAPSHSGRRLPLRDTLGLYALLTPTFALLATFSLVPFLIAIATSFFDYEVGGTAAFVGLANYREYAHDYTFLESFGNLLFFCTFSVVTVMIVPLVVAKLIFSLSSERASYVYRILFLFPIVVPNVAVFLIWRTLIYSDDGLLNNVLGAVGLEELKRGWFSNASTVVWAIAFVGFPFAGGINILIYYAGLTAIPESVHEAALLDGATGVKKFLLVDVPLVMSQIKLLVMLTIIGGIQAFEGVYVLTAGGIGFKSMVPGLWMYYNAFFFQRMGYACAIGVILFLLILTLTVINLRYFKTSEQMQGQTT